MNLNHENWPRTHVASTVPQAFSPLFFPRFFTKGKKRLGGNISFFTSFKYRRTDPCTECALGTCLHQLPTRDGATSSILRTVAENQILGRNLTQCSRRFANPLLEKKIMQGKIRSIEAWCHGIPTTYHPVEKYFAMEWVSDRQIIAGSKCSQLLLFDMHNMKGQDVVKLHRRSLHEVRSTSGSHTVPIDGGVHAISSSPSFVQDRVSNVALSPTTYNVRNSRIASAGASYGLEVGIYHVCASTPRGKGNSLPVIKQRRLDIATSCRPKGALKQSHILANHKDWVFGVDWLDDEHLVSCSRDKSIALWKVPLKYSDPCSLPSENPVVMSEPLSQVHHKASVRDVKCHRSRECIVSLSFDGTAGIWNSACGSLKRAGTISLQHKTECVTLLTDTFDHTFAVGSYKGVTYYDSRATTGSEAVLHVSTDDVPGLCEVRSLDSQCDGWYTSVGGGGAGIGFVDVRSGKLLPQTDEFRANLSQSSVAEGTAQLRSSRYLEDQASESIDVTDTSVTVVKAFQTDSVRRVNDGNGPVAVYSHKWDNSSSKICAVGGPLNVGSTGAFVSLRG